ncbi:hypothetical protein [Sedimentibacter sp.]|uniref:hypothetical protein n=1 Tax=Sedimentibacter sp. TaxID=1960295 RepID=UPI0028A603DA|nr:hypothetical protein [Sedimentibacter sp.]
MKLMHTKLPEFIRKMKAIAATMGSVYKECDVVGLENLKTAKMQSNRTGRIERAVEDLAKKEDVYKIEVAVIPRIPESMHSAVIRGFDKDGNPVHAILETINILHPTEDILIHDCPDIIDRRPPIGKH